jgi:hypothetical protein
VIIRLTNKQTMAFKMKGSSFYGRGNQSKSPAKKHKEGHNDGVLDYIKKKANTVKENVMNAGIKDVAKSIVNPVGTVVDMFTDNKPKFKVRDPKNFKPSPDMNSVDPENLVDNGSFLTPPKKENVKKKKKEKKDKDLNTVKPIKVITPKLNPVNDSKKKKKKDLNSNTPKNNVKKEKGMTEEEVSKMPKGA